MKIPIMRKLFFFWLLLACILPLPVYAAGAKSPLPLRLLLIPMKAPSRMYQDFLPLKHYLEKRLHRTIKLDVARKNSEIAALFRDKKTDIAFVCPTLYCDLTRVVPVVPLVKLKINGSDQYRSALVVRKDSSITRVADLIGHTLVYGRHSCPGSGLLPRIMMQRVGLSDDSFFEVVKLGNDESALLTVMGRMFDVTGVPEMAASPFTSKGLRILRYSEPIPQYLFVARTGLTRHLINQVKAAMLDLNQAPNRKVLIGGIEKGVDGFTDAHDSDYDIVRVLMESLRRSKGRFPLRRGRHNLVVEPLYYDADLFRRLKPFLTKLRLETGWKYHLLIPPDITAFLKISKEGKGDLYLQESGLERRHSSPKNEPLGSLALIPPAMNIGVIIAAASGNIKDMLDLKGKKIGVPSRLAEGEYMVQTRWLQKRGIPPDTMRFVPLRTCERVLMAVYRGDVSAGFLTLDTLHRLQKDLQPNRIVILWQSRPLANWLLSARKNLPGFVKDKIRKILIKQPLSSPKDGAS